MTPSSNCHFSSPLVSVVAKGSLQNSKTFDLYTANRTLFARLDSPSGLGRHRDHRTLCISAWANRHCPDIHPVKPFQAGSGCHTFSPSTANAIAFKNIAVKINNRENVNPIDSKFARVHNYSREYTVCHWDKIGPSIRPWKSLVVTAAAYFIRISYRTQ